MVTKLVRAFITITAVIVMVLIGTTGCSDIRYHEGDFVGHWEVRGPRGERAMMDLTNHGSAAMSGIPRSVFHSGAYVATDWDDTVNLSGTWSPAPPGTSEIYVTANNVSIIVWAQGHGEGMTLNTLGGTDPDRSPTLTFNRD